MHRRTQYAQDIHYNIPSDWLICNSPLGYMDRDGWHKSMSHFPSMCCSSTINPQLLFYDGHVSHFYDRALYILCRRNIQSLIIKSGDYVHGHPNNRGPKTKLNNFYGNARMNWMRHHVTLNFTPPHMNFVLFETWESFKLSSATITQKAFKKTHLPPLSPPYIVTNHQYCLDGTQKSNREKSDDIGRIENSSIDPIDME